MYDYYLLICCINILLAVRKGEMKEMKQLAGKTRLIFLVPSRSLVGFRVSVTCSSIC